MTFNTKTIITLLLIILHLEAYSQLTNEEIRNHKTDKITYTDTSYIYQFPYKVGKKYLIVQGSNSKFSHKNELALDFKMKKGSKICAARDGIVLDCKKDSKVGGIKEEYLSQGNYIIILHSDGTKAKYWHLSYDGVFVKIGQKIKKGEIIGLSGNTGYSAFPHLHFKVVDKNDNDILVRFKTKKGAKYPRPERRYKCVP